jgi:Ca2+-binding RTX toxin-like protein
MSLIIGRANDRILNGSAGDDLIEGPDGNDSITGGGVVNVPFPQGTTAGWVANQPSRLGHPEAEGH